MKGVDALIATVFIILISIVGIAIVVGIQMFGSSTASANFDAVMSDLTNYGANAQSWFKKPTTMGGGGRSFADITADAIQMPASNNNGSYSIVGVPAAANFTIQGLGNEDSDGDGTKVTIQVTIYADSLGTPNIISR